MKIDNLSEEQIKFLGEECNCPEAYGFEGPQTFSGCGECIICLCHKKLSSILKNNEDVKDEDW